MTASAAATPPTANAMWRMVVSFAALLTMRSSVAAAVCSRLERRGAANRSNAITNAKDTNLRPLEGVKLTLCP